MPIALADLIAALDDAYPPSLALGFDAVGLTTGDPAAEVDRVLLAVDPVEEVVDEAIGLGAQLIVTHHPLLLRGVHGVAATTPKGAVVHRLIRSGIALFTAHTNADRAVPGVSDALAAAVGLTGGLRPIEPVEGRRDAGLGRIGELPAECTLAEFTERVAAALPATAGGLRVAGEPDRPVRTVAVGGGAGDGLLDAVRAAGVDAFVTADLRHHPASEFRQYRGPALIDVAHWASEWPWLSAAASVLRRRAEAGGHMLVADVSTRVTDAWTYTAAQGVLSQS